MKYTLLCGLILGFFVLTVDISHAADLSSPSFHLKIDEFSFNLPPPSPTPDGSSKSLAYPSPIPQSIYPESGYLSKEGYDYLTEGEAFTAAFEPTTISFESLFPDQSSVKDVKLSIKLPKYHQFQILTASLSPLTTAGHTTISRTPCDDPNLPCSIRQASSWENTLVHGYGFTMTGISALPDFVHGTLFRPFPLLDREGVVQIASGISDETGKSSLTMRYKLILGEDQPAGIYQNIHTLVFVPSY